MLEQLIQKLYNKYQRPHRIIAFKGIELKSLPENIHKNLMDNQVIEGFKIKDEKFFDVQHKRFLLRSLMDTVNHCRVLSYESLLFGYNQVNKDLIADEVLIIDLSINSLVPNNFADFSKNIEDDAEKGEFLDLNEFRDIIASSSLIDDNLYLQFADGKLFNEISLIPVIEKVNWDYQKLTTIQENQIVDNDFIFNYENKEFIALYYDTIKNKSIVKDILIDNETIQSELASEQLSILLGAFNLFNISYNIKRVKSDLKKSYRSELNGLLEKYWQSNSFRSLKIYPDPDINKNLIEISQATVVESIVEQFENSFDPLKDVQDVFLTAPTGAGKSLLFQMPAMYIGEKYGALSIVVSPLKALMVDQVNQLRHEKGYTKVAYINSDITLIQRDQIIEDIKEGEIDLLYMAPELLLSYDISYFLNGRKLGLYIVDEAHTVSTWGRDFRIDYWYLGYHISRIRNYARDSQNKKMKFPVIAVTATAPYGKQHDVVFETMRSLQMKAPITFIGYAKRDDITFEINHLTIEGNLQTEKVNLTTDRIAEFEVQKDKTIVYCPFTTQVDALMRASRNTNVNTHPYNGRMDVKNQEASYNHFKNDEVVTMVATKAFGMGVDINDVSRVHHLAPTGLLTDYIQEIGRAARDKEINGIASLDYSSRDFQFINQLHGLSRTHHWQLREVMRRLVRIYDDTSEQNQLITAEDFGYIFPDADNDQLQGEVKKALLLIEKDLNKKASGIPVLIARPKNMFSTVFASFDLKDLNILENVLRENEYKLLQYPTLKDKGRGLIELRLDELWERKFRDKSFGIIKREFFNNTLFKEIDLKPILRISLGLENSKSKIQNELKNIFNILQSALLRLSGSFFTSIEFKGVLIDLGVEDNLASRMSELLLPMFSQRAAKNMENLKVDDVRKKSNFLQARRDKGGVIMKYRVIDYALGALRKNVRRKIEMSFNAMSSTVKYVNLNSGSKFLYIKIGQLLEVFELGNYEVTGGENPRIYVRINDPFRLRNEAFSEYKNSLLQDISNRHVAGVDLMREFFEKEMTSDDRWNFIEDYLLGYKY
ncbi:helicase-related protein [Mesonia sp.]|uniref:helicase-related protein n=1 Tax=Mesonia sp. TaxID=1960830 RepID=UPI001779E8A4|nr:helicase-related protein [Mesonia sp.]HIB36982.1 ATP-dependent DNA helicase RecQ [Mesonia sp.]